MKSRSFFRLIAGILGLGQSSARVKSKRYPTGDGVARARLAPTRTQEKARRLRQMQKGMLTASNGCSPSVWSNAA